MRVQLLAVTGALVVAGAVAAVGAQEPGPARREGRMGRPDAATIQAELGLSADQAAQLKKLRNDGRKQAIRQRADLAIARIELEEAMDAPSVDEKLVAARVKAVSDLEASSLKARTDQRLAMRRLLTPEQQEKMKQLMRAGPDGAGRGTAGASGRPGRRGCPARGARRALVRLPRGPARAAAVTSPALALPLGLAASAAPGGSAASPREAEREAIEACRRGEREAFDRLVERYQRDVYRLCYRYVNDHEDANDLAQEVFIKAWRAIGRFRGESAFSTWLYRIAVNACLNFRALRRPITQELPETLTDPVPLAAARVESDDEARRVRAAIGRLPEKQRATLILKIYHELTHEEVAEILGSTVGTVKANLFHALGNLRRLVGEEGR